MSRLRSRLRFWWMTRHWDRSHFPGCPIRYGSGSECISPDVLCRWMKDNR